MNRKSKLAKRKVMRAEKITAYNKGFRLYRENYHPYLEPTRLNQSIRLANMAKSFDKGWDDAIIAS